MGKQKKQKKRVAQNAKRNSTTNDIKGRALAFQEVSLLKNMKEKEDKKDSQVTKHKWLQSMKKDGIQFPHPDLFFQGEMKFRNTFERCDPIEKKLPSLSQLLKRDLFTSSAGEDCDKIYGTRKVSPRLTCAEERFLSYTEVIESDGLIFDRKVLKEMEASAADLVEDETMDVVCETLPIPFAERRRSILSFYAHRRDPLVYRGDSLGFRRDSLSTRRSSLGSVFTRQSSFRSIGSTFTRQSSLRSLDSRASIGSGASSSSYTLHMYQQADDPSLGRKTYDGSDSSFEESLGTARDVLSLGVEGPTIRDLFGDFGNDSQGRRWQQRCDVNELLEQELMEVEIGVTEARRIQRKLAKRISEEDNRCNEDEHSSCSKRSLLSEISQSRRSELARSRRSTPAFQGLDYEEAPVIASNRKMFDDSEALQYDSDDSYSQSVVSAVEEGSYSTSSSWTSVSYYSSTQHRDRIASRRSAPLSHPRRRSLESTTSSSSTSHTHRRSRNRSDSDGELYTTHSMHSHEIHSSHSNDYTSSIGKGSSKDSALVEEDPIEELDTRADSLSNAHEAKSGSFVVSNLEQSVARIKQGTDAVFMDDSEQSEDFAVSLVDQILSSEGKMEDKIDQGKLDAVAKDLPQSYSPLEESSRLARSLHSDRSAATALLKSTVVSSKKETSVSLIPDFPSTVPDEANTQHYGATTVILAIDDAIDRAVTSHDVAAEEPFATKYRQPDGDESTAECIALLSPSSALIQAPPDSADDHSIEDSPLDRPHSLPKTSGNRGTEIHFSDSEMEKISDETSADSLLSGVLQSDVLHTSLDGSEEDAVGPLFSEDEQPREESQLHISIKGTRLNRQTGPSASQMSSVAAIPHDTTLSLSNTQETDSFSPVNVNLEQASNTRPAVAVSAVTAPKLSANFSRDSNLIGISRGDPSLARSVEDDDFCALPESRSLRGMKGRSWSKMHVTNHHAEIPDRSASFTTMTDSRRKSKLPRGMAQLPSWWVESVPHEKNEKMDSIDHLTKKKKTRGSRTDKGLSASKSKFESMEDKEGKLTFEGVEADYGVKADEAVERFSVDAALRMAALPTGVTLQLNSDVVPIFRGPDRENFCERPECLPRRDSPTLEKKCDLTATAAKPFFDSRKEAKTAKGGHTPPEDKMHLKPPFNAARHLVSSSERSKSAPQMLTDLDMDLEVVPNTADYYDLLAQAARNVKQTVSEQEYAQIEHRTPSSGSASAKRAHFEPEALDYNDKRELEQAHHISSSYVIMKATTQLTTANLVRETSLLVDDAQSGRAGHQNIVKGVSTSEPLLGKEKALMGRAQKEKLGEALFASIVRRSDSRRDLSSKLSEEPNTSCLFPVRGTAYRFFSTNSESALLCHKNEADAFTAVNSKSTDELENHAGDEEKIPERQLLDHSPTVGDRDDEFPDDLGSRWKNTECGDAFGNESKFTTEYTACAPVETNADHSPLQTEGERFADSYTAGSTDRRKLSTFAEMSGSLSKRWVIKNSEYSPTPEIQSKAAELSKNRQRRGSLGQRIKTGLADEARATQIQKTLKAEKSFSSKKGVKSTAVGRALGSFSEGSRRRGSGLKHGAAKKTPWYKGFMLWKKHTEETFDRGKEKLWSAGDVDSVGERSETASLADNKMGFGIERKLWRKELQDIEKAKRRSSWSASSSRSVNGASDSGFDFDAPRRRRRSRDRGSKQGTHLNSGSELVIDLEEFLSNPGLPLDRVIDEDERQEPNHLA